MQRHVKVAEEKPESGGHMKWWISVGMLALVSVCAFIGITLWLGLNVESGDSRKTVAAKSDNFDDEKMPSAPRTEKQQTVVGAANEKTNEDNEGEGRKQYDEAEVAPTTELVYKDLGEEAYVEEVRNSQTTSEIEDVATDAPAIRHEDASTSGSPLDPQPITETPTLLTGDPTAEETATRKKEPPPTAASSRKKYPEHESTTLSALPYSGGTEVAAGRQPAPEPLMFSESEHDAGELLHTSEENSPLTSEDDIVSAFLGQGIEDVRHFDISDVVNEKGEHFMPQNFDYPHDRDYVPLQQSANLHVTKPSIAERLHEITEDGVDRDGVPSLDHDDGLFYSSRNPDRYDGEDPDLAENPFATFLQGRLQELYNWLSTDEDLAGKHAADSDSLSGDFMKVLVALNRSLNEGNSSFLLDQLKEMYYNESALNVTDPAVLHNSSSLVSFGLLAFDLLLLRNVQQIAWEEERLSSEEMLRDPEVLALNALFMPPEKVRQLQEPTSRIGKENKEDDSDKSLLQEFMEFVAGSLRAVVNLGRAYRWSVAPAISSLEGSNALDCIWTLYCRNLDKTARLNGPYGFLAKMNSLGLRMLMGEFPVESALERLVSAVTLGWGHMDCEKMFPRCAVTEATDIVLKTALGITGET